MPIYISKLVSSIIMMIANIYTWYKLLDKKISFKNVQIVITIFSLSFLSIANYYIVNQYIRIICITVVLMIFFKYLFSESIQKCIITPIYSQFLIMISETTYAVVLIFIFNKDSTAIINTYFGEFFSNIIISIILISIINLKFVVKIYHKIIDFTDKIKKSQLVLFSSFLIILANIFAAISYYKINYQYIIVINAIVTVVLYIIIIYSFKTQNNYNKVSDKYNIVINSLKDYEDMMTKYRIANHENKNLLLTIRAMILNNEDEIPKYIDSIVREKYNDNEKILFKMNVIPSGGLRATIYSEILKIQENKIDYVLNIDRNIKTIALIDFDTNTIIDICKIIGVFIDNAIEEVNLLTYKNIIIDLGIENENLYIKVSNNYNNKIDINKIFDEGYTTKGEGHGYGLSLVKKIIDNNDIFDNIIEINKDLFSQKLIIKYKKRG